MNLRISYCLDILAKAAETNRQKDVKRSVLLRLGDCKPMPAKWRLKRTPSLTNTTLLCIAVGHPEALKALV